MKQQMYVCRKIRLYDYLTKQGFRPVFIRADKNDPNRNVWIYENSIELKYAIETYYSMI
jgi:hypothetical protein